MRETCLKSICMKKKGHPTHAYIGQGGVPPSLHFRGGTNPKGGGFWRSPRGVGPPSWRHGPWGRTPSPPNGPYEAHMSFNYFLIILNYILIFNSDN